MAFRCFFKLIFCPLNNKIILIFNKNNFIKNFFFFFFLQELSKSRRNHHSLDFIAIIKYFAKKFKLIGSTIVLTFQPKRSYYYFSFIINFKSLFIIAIAINIVIVIIANSIAVSMLIDSARLGI